MLVTTPLKKKAESILLDGICRLDHKIIERLIAKDFIEHTPDFQNGWPGFRKYIAQLEYSELNTFFHEDIIQDALPGLVADTEEFQQHGIPINIECIHQVLGEGNRLENELIVGGPIVHGSHQCSKRMPNTRIITPTTNQ